MAQLEKVKNDNPTCRHAWVKQDKKYISVMKRCCSICGDEDLTTDCSEISLTELKKVFK